MPTVNRGSLLAHGQRQDRGYNQGQNCKGQARPGGLVSSMEGFCLRELLSGRSFVALKNLPVFNVHVVFFMMELGFFHDSQNIFQIVLRE